MNSYCLSMSTPPIHCKTKQNKTKNKTQRNCQFKHSLPLRVLNNYEPYFGMSQNVLIEAAVMTKSIYIL